jgi:hypothetical protein
LEARSELLSVPAHGHESAGGEIRLRGGIRSDPPETRCDCGGRCRPRLQNLLESSGQRVDVSGRRRAPSFRLECVLLMPLPQRPASPCRAALSRGTRLALVAHLHPRHQARSAPTENRQGDRAGGDRREDRLYPPAHGALRSRRDLCGCTCRQGGQGAGRRFHDRPRELRAARPLGGRPRLTAAQLRRLVAPRLRHAGDERMVRPTRSRTVSSRKFCSVPTTGDACISGTSRGASISRRSISARTISSYSSCGLRTIRPRPTASSIASSASRICRPRSGPGIATAANGRPPR